MADFDGLTPKQLAALEALITARTFGEAAKTAKVDRSTLRLWLNEDPAFRAAYKAIRAEAFDSLSLGLTALGEKAVEAYRDVLEGPALPGAATLGRVADSIISNIFRLRELVELEERMATIEAQLASKPAGFHHE